MDDQKNGETLDRHDQVLLGLVLSLQTAGMQQLGKLVHPQTGEIGRDLQQARATIDVLEMLKAKCGPTVPREVARVLSTAVMELQMNWLDEVKRERAAAQPPPDPPAGDGERERGA